MEFKLFEPVFANQTITARAVAARHEQLNGRVRVGLDIWCERQEDGKKTSAGSACVDSSKSRSRSRWYSRSCLRFTISEGEVDVGM